MYSIYAFDQVDKNELPGESRKQYELRYKSDLSNSVAKLKAMIDAKGWVADRIIGVDQNDIVKELKLSGIDLHEYYTKYKTQMARNSQGQFTLNEYYFSSTIVFPLILHNGMFDDIHSKRRYFIYSDSFYMNEIIKGNMHPKDLASLYDKPYIFVEGSKPDTTKGEKYFGIGLRMVDTQANALRVPDELINKFRKELYIAPIENDRAKQSFFIRNKMYIGWGYGGIRS